MLSKVKESVAVAAGFVGAGVEWIETGLFAMVTAEVSPLPLFKPLGISMAAAVAPLPFLEEHTDRKVLKFLGYIPTAAANTAIFFYEGPTAVAIFTAVLGASVAMMTVELALKRAAGELTKTDVVEFALKTGKLGAMVLTINLDGMGEVFKLIEHNKTVPVATKITAGVAAGLAGIGGLIGFYKNADRAKKLCEKSQEEESIEYTALSIP